MIVDAIVALIMLASTAIAFFRGFIRESLTIMGVAGGLAAAFLLGPVLKPVVSSWLTGKESGGKIFDIIPADLMINIVSYGAVFIIVVIGLSIISHIISAWAKTAGLGAVDRSLGVVFGLARGVLILGLLYTPVYYLVEPETRSEYMEGARSQFYLEKTASFILAMFPSEDVQEDINQATKNAAKVMSTTARDKLKNLEILPADEVRKNTQELLKQHKDEILNKSMSTLNAVKGEGENAEDKTGQGYHEQDREVLEQMFKEELND